MISVGYFRWKIDNLLKCLDIRNKLNEFLINFYYLFTSYFIYLVQFCDVDTGNRVSLNLIWWQMWDFSFCSLSDLFDLKIN